MATKLVTEHGTPESEVPIPPERQDSVSDSSVSLTTGEENTVNIVEGDLKYVLDNEGHHMYLRLGRALLYLKEPLHEPVRSEISKLHHKLLDDIRKRTKSGVSQEIILNDYLNSKWLDKSDVNNKIYIKNVTIGNWENQPWETGKAFMQSGQLEGNKRPEDTDTMGILRLISGCKQFDDWLKVDADGVPGREKVQKVLKVRHSVGHSNSLCCSETEMKEGIKQIKLLMEHMKQRFKNFADDGNVLEDDKRIYQEAEKKMEDALHSVEKVMTDTDFDVMRRLVVEDICKSRAYESYNETQRKEIAKVQLRYATTNIVIFLNDLYKKRSKEFKDRLQDQGILESFITEANSDVKFLLAALEEKQMFQAEKMDALLQLIKPLHKENDYIKIKTSMMICKATLERTSDIAFATVYDVIILHCEADREKANTFRQRWLDIPQDLNPPAKTILYDEYMVPGTSLVSALDNVFEDCRLVFILCTQDFMKDNLCMFQAEMVKYNSLEKNKGPRVIPVYLRDEDLKCSPQWIRVMIPICVWKLFNQTSLMNTLKDGRKKYLKSCQ